MLTSLRHLRLYLRSLAAPSTISFSCAVLLFGCAQGRTPCLGPTACGAREDCVAARCVPEGSAPVNASSRRFSVSASNLGVTLDERALEVGPSVVLGSAAGDATLYLRFSPIWRGRHVEAAFLVLAPMPATLTGDDVPLEVFRLRGPWGAAPNTRGTPSPLAFPRARGIGRSAPSLPVRIDVTPIVQYLAKNPSDESAFAVRARDEVPPGLAIATGFDGGTAPRLEIYVD